MYGGSTTCAPAQVSIMNNDINNIIDILLFIIIEEVFILGCAIAGIIINMKIDITRANTPPNFLGIDRRIA
jgi:hypothetical protein